MIPWETLTTLSLDVGNTLVSVDFERIAPQVAARGLACEPAALRRAEAAARPALSARAAAGASTEGEDSFSVYVHEVLRRLPAAAGRDPEELRGLARELAAAVGRPGASNELWNAVLPGVPEALRRLREAGFALIAVSNSDGTVERALEQTGLRAPFAHVIDSAVVGFEKPDPRIFALALERAGARPAQVLHVGDILHVDVGGARAAGLHAALLDPYDDWRDTDCPRFRDLAELARRAVAERMG